MNTTSRPPTPRRRLLVALGVAVLLLGAAACGGSQLSPEKVLEANARVRGEAGTGAGTTMDSGLQPGTVTGTGTDTGAGTGTGTTGTTGTSGTGPGTTGSGTSGSGTGSTGSGSNGGSAGVGVKAGSCAGFKNQTGITDQAITIGNGSDVSGPVPGLFTAAQQATKAYVSYFNSTSSICGRKLALQTADTRTDAGADQQASLKFCDSAFATVGGMSTFDSGGAGAAQNCGMPDVRAIAVTGERNNCKVCFAASATGDGEFTNEVDDFFIRNYKAASQKAAFLWLNVGAAAENGKVQSAFAKRRGFNVVYTQAIDVAEFNYGPYVQALKAKGVKWVQFLGAYQQEVRFAQAMKAANYKPDVFMLDPSAYDQNFLDTGKADVEGTIIYINFTPFEESQKELDLYKSWLQQAAPGARPTFFGLYAWSASKLFVEQAIALGGKLDRGSLVAKLRTVKAWTGGGMHGPMQVGAKHAPSCIRFLQVKGGKFVPLKGTKYVCGGSGKG